MWIHWVIFSPQNHLIKDHGSHCFLIEETAFYGKYTALFNGKSSLGLSKWKTLDFNVVLGSMLKVLWVLDLAIEKSSVGWNNWEKNQNVTYLHPAYHITAGNR